MSTDLRSQIERMKQRKEADYELLRSIPDTRAYEDGTLLSRHIQMDRLIEEAKLLGDVLAILSTAEQPQDWRVVDAALPVEPAPLLPNALDIAETTLKSLRELGQARLDASVDGSDDERDWEQVLEWSGVALGFIEIYQGKVTPLEKIRESRSPDGDGLAAVVPALARPEQQPSVPQRGSGRDNRGAGSEPADSHQLLPVEPAEARVATLEAERAELRKELDITLERHADVIADNIELRKEVEAEATRGTLQQAIDRETETACAFNCDAESSCECFAHEFRHRVLASLTASRPTEEK